MNYNDNDLYKAYKLKLNYLKKKLSGQHDLALEKLGMFAEDAFSEQQATIDRLEKEKQELIEMIMVSNMAIHYQTFQVAKKVARGKVNRVTVSPEAKERLISERGLTEADFE